MKSAPGTPINLDVLDKENKIYLPILKEVTPKEATHMENYGAMVVMSEEGDYYIYSYGSFVNNGWDKLGLPTITDTHTFSKINSAKLEMK